MRRKLFYLIICFICMFTFCNSVYGLEACDNTPGVDHSFNYEINNFSIDNGNLTIEGWALVHNCHNWGGISGTQSYSGYGLNVDGLTANNSGYQVYFYFKKGSQTVGFNSDGSPSILADFSRSNDFTDDFCYKGYNSNCLSGAFVYKNNYFKKTIDIDGLGLAEGEWSLYIGIKHKGYGGALSETMAVPQSAVHSNDERFTVGHVSTKANVSGNHVTFYGNGANYWKLTNVNGGAYRIASSRYDSSNGYNVYNLCYNGARTYYKVSSPYYNGSNGVDSVCGFSWDDRLDDDYMSCVIPYSGYSCSSSSIKGIFVKTRGAVTLTIKNPENFVCAPSNDTLDGCTGDSAHAVCSKMTIYPYKKANGEIDKSVYAIVEIDEQISLTSGEDSSYIDSYNSYFGGLYSKYYVIPGRTFHYKLTYTDTASWKFVKVKTSGSYTVNQVKNDVRNLKMADYYNPIGSSFSDVTISASDSSSSSIFNFNDGGSWSCSDGGTKEKFIQDNGDDGGTATLTCTYDLKYLYVNGDGTTKYLDTPIYSPDGTELTLGRNIYIPMTYTEDKFNWTVTNNSSTGLSTIKVRNSKDNVNSITSLLNLNINSDSGVCYVNIGKSNTIDDSASGGTDPSNLYITEEDKFYAYRSVDVSNPFPDGKYAKNWNKDSDRLRLTKAYDNLERPDYRFNFNRVQIDNVRANTVNYVSWNGIKANEIDSSATSQFVSDYVSSSNSILGRNWCYYGIFDDNCNEKVG